MVAAASGAADGELDRMRVQPPIKPLPIALAEDAAP
jgi:hypothetical protein